MAKTAKAATKIKKAVTKTTKAKTHYPTADEQAPNVPRAAYSIPEFCAAHRLSIAMYQKLKAAKKGPVEAHIGARVVISLENAATWLKEIEDAEKTSMKKDKVPA